MNVDYTEQSIISFCTGIRGLERGIERALGYELRTVAYAEIEAFIVANLIAGMEAGVLAPAPVWTDLKTFPSQQFHRKVHGIIGGYPCQPFSIAGQQRGVDDPRHLWPFIAKHIWTIEPLWCFFENVPGHLNIGFREVKSELEEMGYAVEAGIYSAQEVGAPHKRDRLFILAIKMEYPGLLRPPVSEIKTTRIEQSSEKLGDSESSDQQRNILETGYEEKQAGGSGSDELADPNSSPAIRRDRDIPGQTEEGKGKEQREIREWNRDKPEHDGKSNADMAHPDNKGLQRWISGILQKRSSECTARPSSAWPARPGESQYDWEEPRTAQSGMGVTIAGYNFREDLLRAAGNAVVEQTAELAFIDLLRKFNDRL